MREFLKDKKAVIKLILAKYKESIKLETYNEIYKWKAIKKFQDSWNLEGDDFVKMLNESLSLADNLLSSAHFFAKKMILEFAKDNPEYVREMFRALYNESLDLKSRINQFKRQSKELNAHHDQSTRSISVYLSFKYPEKYYFYISTAYTRVFYNYFGIKFQGNDINKQLLAYDLAEELKEEIKKDIELVNNNKNHLDDSCYKDENLNVLTQDVIWVTNYMISDKKVEEKIMNYPLNTILYGPPGTGKTYHTKDLAVKIIEELDDSEFNEKYSDRKSLNDIYKQYKNDGRIEFATFHQSFSYEDFIEGIKPIVDEGELAVDKDEDISSLKYTIEDGIFKSIASKSKSSINLQSISNNVFTDELINSLDKINFSKVSLGRAGTDEAEKIYKYCIENDCIVIGWGEYIDFKDVSSEDDVRPFLLKNEIKSSYAVTAIKCIKFWLKKGDMIFVSNGTTKIKAIGIVDGDYYFNQNIFGNDYHQFRKVKWLLKDIDISVSEVYERNFSQQTIYLMFNEKIKKEFFKNLVKGITPETKRNHVLIIDEINRGNIANIFGELITLIEEDKREGKSEALETILPYSKKSFSVPPNLYIIGTMNTADRSIEALDTALRRRFSFVEYQPEPELIATQGKLKDKTGKMGEIDLVILLKTINFRIEKLLDKDHLIGHSYFLTVENLNDLRITFRNKIIPLLQEYFFGDFGKIGLVLGKGFFGTVETSDENIFADFGEYDASEFSEKIIYKLKDISKMSDEEFRNSINILYKK